MKRFGTGLLPLIWIFWFFEAEAQISYREYRVNKRIAEYIMSQYPPSEYFYLGVGASPTAIIAYLELVAGSNQVGHLPITSGKQIKFMYDSNHYIVALMDGIMDRHLRNFLPHQVIGSRKILLIDFAHHGVTLPLIGEIMGDHLEERGLRNSVSMFAMTRNRNLETDLRRLPNMDVYHLGAYAEALFMGQRFDSYRKYEKAPLASLNSVESYRPPARVVSEVPFSDFIDKTKQGIFVPHSYDHLLIEMERFLRWDLYQHVQNLVRSRPKESRIRCQMIYRF